MQTINKKILNTKQSLWLAFSTLIEKQHIQEITVSQLCREAGINRTTFYKYYALPIDILTDKLESLYEMTLHPFELDHSILSTDALYQVMLKMCRIYSENKQILKVFQDANRDLMNIMQKIIGPGIQRGLKENALNSFISGGVSSIIFQWSIYDYKETPEEVAKLLTDYIIKLQINA